MLNLFKRIWSPVLIALAFAAILLAFFVTAIHAIFFALLAIFLLMASKVPGGCDDDCCSHR